MTLQVLSPMEDRVQPAPSAPSAVSHRTINRFELKYLVPHTRMAGVLAAMDGYVRNDPHGGENGYRVHSVYWDSPRHRFFWEKIDGEKIRRKLRFRTYGERADIFVEIKGRIDRTVQKRRVILPPEQYERLLAPGSDWYSEPEGGRGHPILSEVFCLMYENNLRPTAAVTYRRKALFAIYERDLRITFDTRVQYSTRELDVRQPADSGRYIVDPRLAIMEVKFNHRVPLWLIRLISRFDLAAIRMSKYCSAVDRGFYGHQFT